MCLANVYDISPSSALFIGNVQWIVLMPFTKQQYGNVVRNIMIELIKM